MSNPAVTSVLDLLKDVDLDADDLLDLVKGLGLQDAQIVALLGTLTADVTWDTSVTYHAVQDVLAAIQDERAALAALQTDVDAQFAVIRATLAQILADIEGPPAPTPGPPVGVTLTVRP